MTEDTEKPHNPLDNLKPWQKGQSGNPAGMKPGTKHRSTILRNYLGVVYQDSKGNRLPQPFGMEGAELTVEEAIDVALIGAALNGNVHAVKEIKDTIYGKNPDIVQGDPDHPVVHKVDAPALTGQALIDHLKALGLPTEPFER